MGIEKLAMQDTVLNSLTDFTMATAGVLSLAAGFFLFQRHIDGRPLLAYEPRRRVPWGPLVLVIPLSFLVINFLPLLGDSESNAETMTSAEFVYSGLVISAGMIAFVAIAMAWLAAVRQADHRDLGLPLSQRQFWRDARCGVVACMAALLPILLLNFVLTNIFQPEKIHPLIDRMQKDGSPAMLFFCIVSAVLAAPLFEEFTFRVLLQGWLERVEDKRLDFHATERQTVPFAGDPVAKETAAGEDLERFSAEPTPMVETISSEQSPQRPQHGWLAALPHGWTPILISSLVFGLAHIGHGVAPVPLVFLGIVFGYLYQRTHRIVPCIAAHMLFNAYSLTLLWLNLENTPP